MGFQGFFFARIDHADYKLRVNKTNLEMVWNPSPLVGGAEANIFTGALYNGYLSPIGFCFDISCDDAPIQVRVKVQNIFVRSDTHTKCELYGNCIGLSNYLALYCHKMVCKLEKNITKRTS